MHASRMCPSGHTQAFCCAAAAPGLDYLHSVGIMHCDLKPANVLLKSTASNGRGFTCKLCDFGMSRLLDLQQPATHVSTLTFGVCPLLFLAGMLKVICRWLRTLAC